MCRSCWDKARNIFIDNENVREAAALANKIYEFSLTGANLHILLDDWNVQDKHVDTCFMENYRNDYELGCEELHIEYECLLAFEKLSVNERISALALKEGFVECNYLENNDLKEVVREFIGYLDIVEESDSGKEFHPITVGCCRAHLLDKVDNCLKRMKELSKKE